MVAPAPPQPTTPQAEVVSSRARRTSSNAGPDVLKGSALSPDPLQPPGHSRPRIGSYQLRALLGVCWRRSSKDHLEWGSRCSLAPEVGQRFCEIAWSQRLSIRFL